MNKHIEEIVRKFLATANTEYLPREWYCPTVAIDYLRQALLTYAAKEREELEAKYHELLLAVGNKYDGETRHETALRYIRNAESSNSTASDTPEPPTSPKEKKV